MLDAESPSPYDASAASLDVDLSAGSYVLICNVVNHYSLGMHTSFTVA